ncbi:MAG: hypothetical protein PVF87_10805 [Acidimicrobiia bacterium]|jgi:hypothetical protein
MNQQSKGRQLKPEHPEQAGIAEETPDQSHIEGAELLANESREALRGLGFTDDEIDEWALTYIAENRTGDVESFLAWVAEKEGDAAS